MAAPNVTIVPSYPAPSYEALATVLSDVSNLVTDFQVDIVDGQFVTSTSWPFTTPNPIEALTALCEWSTTFTLEIDCMVNEPLQYLDQLISIGAKRIIIHHGSTDDFPAIVAHQRTHGYELGYAITNDVSVADVTTELAACDFVQVMGIAVVGAQGQPFDSRTIDTLESLRARYPQLPLAVDGSVNQSTITALVAAGATRVCPGSAIVNAPDRSAAIAALRAMLTVD